MKVLASYLNLTEATEMIKETELAMYRMAWIEEGFHPAEVAVGFNEDGELYDIAGDTDFVIAQEDVLAQDWVVIAIEDGETIEDSDSDTFDEAVLEILLAFRKMNKTHTNLPRCKFFEGIAKVVIPYFGEETMNAFMQTGILVHDDKCVCPACEQTRFEADPEAFATDKAVKLFKGLAEKLEGEAQEGRTPKTGLDIDGNVCGISGEELLGLLLDSITSQR